MVFASRSTLHRPERGDAYDDYTIVTEGFQEKSNSQADIFCLLTPCPAGSNETPRENLTTGTPSRPSATIQEATRAETPRRGEEQEKAYPDLCVPASQREMNPLYLQSLRSLFTQRQGGSGSVDCVHGLAHPGDPKTCSHKDTKARSRWRRNKSENGVRPRYAPICGDSGHRGASTLCTEEPASPGDFRTRLKAELRTKTCESSLAAVRRGARRSSAFTRVQQSDRPLHPAVLGEEGMG